MSTTPLTDAIEALTRYANETTGASDTTLSDAVGTLVAGYGGGGGGGLSLLDTITVSAVNGVRIDIDPTWFTSNTFVLIVPDLTYSASDWMYVINDATSGGQYTGGSWPGLGARYSAIIRTKTSGYWATWFRDEGGSGLTTNYSITEYLYWHLYASNKTMTGTFKIYGIPL